MGSEKAVDVADVVADENSKAQTEKARPENEAAVERSEAMACEGKRQGESGGDEHHASNCADTEDKQIEERPFGIANRA